MCLPQPPTPPAAVKYWPEDRAEDSAPLALVGKIEVRGSCRCRPLFLLLFQPIPLYPKYCLSETS
eukprot:8117569-Pyramimonas_sp.AAC.2